MTRLGHIERSPHAGLTVHGGRVSCECVLALVAATEKSKGNKFGSGFRVLTKNVRDCDPWGIASSPTDVFQGQLASICTVENLTEYTLMPPRPGEPQHALVVISNVTDAAAGGAGATVTVEHVEQVGASAVADVAKMLRKLGTLARAMPAASDGTQETQHWQSQESTPWTQRKARRLAMTPTDASIPDTQVTPASSFVPGLAAAL